MVNELKILGLVLDSKYSFKAHCKHIKDCLVTRLNIIKYLTSKKSLIHPLTLINVTKALVISKIDYALPIYGNCPASTMKILSPPYHVAMRRSIRAFPTTPLKNLFAETGLPTIIDRTIDCTRRLLPKLLFTTNTILAKDAQNALSRKRKPKCLSAIARCVNFARQLELPSYKCSLGPETRPQWMIKNSSFAIKTLQLPKDKTSSEKYRQLFASQKSKYSSYGWNFIYTDGSKTANSSTFAVTKENGDLIRHGTLHTICSSFTAEVVALLEAVTYVNHTRGKYIVCTDSKSCIGAIESPENTQNEIVAIRNNLLKYPNKLKLMWIPGHTGISGNEKADAAAKNAANTPTITFGYFTKQDIITEITRLRKKSAKDNWSGYIHHYSKINPFRIKPTYTADITLRAIKPFTRLRLGHTIITHAYLLQRAPHGNCPFCDENATIQHILTACPITATIRHEIFNSADPFQLLNEPTPKNVNMIYNFFKETDLLRRI
ncbi:uncharacterized protein LOC125780366 [Bactrocera dorsalis]|uniref:ribonuclease H n=1 Tax=Bactrocera dorsalis TaxID=27457 RepID=A0ABM3KAU9_BACDO|nr:uncharacterized protein LOC125780366 [Bactrocera dorsalis]